MDTSDGRRRVVTPCSSVQKDDGKSSSCLSNSQQDDQGCIPDHAFTRLDDAAARGHSVYNARLVDEPQSSYLSPARRPPEIIAFSRTYRFLQPARCPYTTAMLTDRQTVIIDRRLLTHTVHSTLVPINGTELACYITSKYVVRFR